MFMAAPGVPYGERLAGRSPADELIERFLNDLETIRGAGFNGHGAEAV